MYNPFKKEKLKEAILNKENIINDLPKIAAKLYPKEVMEIHHEFNIAAENLLKEANQTIEKAKNKNLNKVLRLESLGFNKASDVTELRPLIEKADLSQQQIKYVKHYQQKYPLNRFITQEQVKSICHKWNLVCGSVDKYKGFVPDKNLKEIEDFQIKKEDCDLLIEFGGGFYTKNFCDERLYMDSERRRKYENKIIDDSYPRIQINKKLEICAPIKDMDTNGMRIENGYKLVNIPDPIVLHPVMGGYLILTCWGPESADENVVNSINN